MCKICRILVMGAGLFLVAAAMIFFGFFSLALPGYMYMAGCLAGLAMIYFPSCGLSGKR